MVIPAVRRILGRLVEQILQSPGEKGFVESPLGVSLTGTAFPESARNGGQRSDPLNSLGVQSLAGPYVRSPGNIEYGAHLRGNEYAATAQQPSIDLLASYHLNAAVLRL